jgi:hypothetical protein
MNTVNKALGVLAMTFALSTPCAVASTLAEQDAAAIETIVYSVATFADRGEFDALERLYAQQVRVDYTSLAGGEPEVKSARALMQQWAAVLPGFDRTRHAISGVQVRVRGTEAKARASVVADHWLGAQHWQVTGHYEYELERQATGWKIAAHRLVLTGETGSRDIFGPAIEAAKARPSAYLNK